MHSLQLMSKSIMSSFFVSIRGGKRWQEAPSSTFTPCSALGWPWQLPQQHGLPAVTDSKQPNTHTAAPYALQQCHAAEDTAQVGGRPSAHDSPREASGRHNSSTHSTTSSEPFGSELRSSSRGLGSGALWVHFPSKESESHQRWGLDGCSTEALRLMPSVSALCPVQQHVGLQRLTVPHSREPFWPELKELRGQGSVLAVLQ